MGGMSPGYFKRKLKPYEAEQYIEGVSMRQRPGWEQARLIAHRTLMPWTKEMKLHDVASFPWEVEEAPSEPTRDEIDSVRQWAAIYAEQLNNIHHG